MELNKRIRDTPIPERLRAMPLSDEGYPVPWFVPWVDGKAEFRAMDGEKFFAAVRQKKCWLCGQQLGRHLCFPIGPMCCITRTTAEPPSHLSCAEYAAKVCPFLTQPRMRRNEKELPDNTSVAGIGIKRNPGVIVLWTTKDFKLFKSGTGWLFTVGEPEHVECYSEGRIASPGELAESIRSGYPILEAMAREDGGEQELRDRLGRAMTVLKISPEMMYIADHGGDVDTDYHHRSGDGRTAGGQDALPSQVQHPGAVQRSPAQPLGGPPLLIEQGERGVGHTIQKGPTGQDGRALEKPGGRRDGLFAQGVRRVPLGPLSVIARKMGLI